MIEEPKPIRPGDQVLVKATVIEIGDDPHDPEVVVWFNGAQHITTVMNIQRAPGKVYRGTQRPPVQTLDADGERFVLDSRPMLPREPPTVEELEEAARQLGLLDKDEEPPAPINDRWLQPHRCPEACGGYH